MSDLAPSKRYGRIFPLSALAFWEKLNALSALWPAVGKQTQLSLRLQAIFLSFLTMTTPDECYACVRMKISCPVHDVKPTADIPAASSDLLKKKEFVFKMTYSFFQHCFNTSCDLPVETPIASEIAVNFEELMVRLNDVSGIVEWIDYYMEYDKKTHLIANGKLTEEAESDDDESDKSEDSEDESTENKTDPWLLRCSCGVQYTARCLNELDYPTVCTKCMEAAISSDLLCRECGVEYKAGDYYEFKYPTSCSSCKAAEERPCMECGDDACDGHPQICEWCGKTADDDTELSDDESECVVTTA